MLWLCQSSGTLFKKHPSLVPSSLFLVFIDSLDECQGCDNQRHTLEQVSPIVNTHYLLLCFPIVSHPEAHLCEAFEEPDLAKMVESLSLYGSFQARSDVSKYLENEFSRTYSSKRYRDVMEFIPRPWPSEDVINSLVDKLGGYFIYASMVIKLIDEEGFSPADHFDQILNNFNSGAPPLGSAPFTELNKLYLEILSLCPMSNLPILKHILGFVVNYSSSILIIEEVLCLPQGQPKLML